MFLPASTCLLPSCLIHQRFKLTFFTLITTYFSLVCENQIYMIRVAGITYTYIPYCCRYLIKLSVYFVKLNVVFKLLACNVSADATNTHSSWVQCEILENINNYMDNMVLSSYSFVFLWVNVELTPETDPIQSQETDQLPIELKTLIKPCSLSCSFQAISWNFTDCTSSLNNLHWIIKKLKLKIIFRLA